MNLSVIQKEVEKELLKAKAKFPDWPNDPVHAAVVVGEESGELLKAALQLQYERDLSVDQVDRMRTEAIQTAAMCYRFLLSLDRYTISVNPKRIQHSKDLTDANK